MPAPGGGWKLSRRTGGRMPTNDEKHPMPPRQTRENRLGSGETVVCTHSIYTATPPIARVATAATLLSAVSWRAVLAGAAGAASLSLILAFFGTNANAESARIFANAIRVGSLNADDSS